MPILQDAERDALTEICSIAMGHAANALSQLMGKTVSIEVPSLRTTDAAALAKQLGAQEIVGLGLKILGNVRGGMLILLKDRDARLMVELLLDSKLAEGAPLSELERSTLMEVGNIVASASLNALGLVLKMTLLPSVPSLLAGEASGVLAKLLGEPADGEPVLTFDTLFSIGASLCGGSILLMPEPASLGEILSLLSPSKGVAR